MAPQTQKKSYIWLLNFQIEYFVKHHEIAWRPCHDTSAHKGGVALGCGQ